jgi:protein-disulfide isomerase
MLRALSIIAGLAIACGAGARADALSPEQRQEVVAVVREALRTDPSILRDAITALQADEARQRGQAVSDMLATKHAAIFADAADPVLGNAAGTVTVVEFYDPRCPYCRQMLPVLSALVADDSRVRVVMKDIPILGEASVLESRALLAAQRQGGYARLQAALMGASAAVTLDSVRQEAKREGLDAERLVRDMADPAIQARIEANLKLAADLHIDGTPALVIGDRIVPGAIGLPDLRAAITASAAQ